jgi:hypothetical protein
MNSSAEESKRRVSILRQIREGTYTYEKKILINAKEITESLNSVCPILVQYNNAPLMHVCGNIYAILEGNPFDDDLNDQLELLKMLLDQAQNTNPKKESEIEDIILKIEEVQKKYCWS